MSSSTANVNWSTTSALETRDPPAAGETGVPTHGVRVGLEGRRSVLHDQRAAGEEPGGRLVVVPVQGSAPRARHLLG